MEKKKVTIRTVAEKAGVSIATVSHVINQTRYVSPELVEKVERCMRETGYSEKVEKKEKKKKKGKDSRIVAVIPNVEGTLYRDMVTCLKEITSSQGYQFMVAITQANLLDEHMVLESLIHDKTVAGIFFSPISNKSSDYHFLKESNRPFVCMERIIFDENIDSVAFKDRDAFYDATSFLAESGHTKIMFIRNRGGSTSEIENTKGYLRALDYYHINNSDVNIVDVNLMQTDEESRIQIKRAIQRFMPTAVIAGGNRLTIHLAKSIQELSMECPEQISVIGFADQTLSELMTPPLSTLQRDVEGLCRLASTILFEKIYTGNVITKDRYANIEFKIRGSIKMLDNGPFGEKAAPLESVMLTEEEGKALRRGKYRVAISFHYMGTAWAALHEKGIRDELSKYGIEIVSVMDANFDAELQNIQLEAINIQKPDVVIAIPTDDKHTAMKFQELSKSTKLVFISNVPETLSKNSYVSCVSVNEWENGSNVGRLLGDYYKNEEKVDIGMIIHGAAFYGTRIRDSAAEKMIRNNYKNVNIVSSRGFGKIENSYTVCKEMMEQNPSIQALYVSWDGPALHAIRALKEMGREDIAVFTTDLDREIAEKMKEGWVKGLSTQRPYEQGRAAALVAAKSLVSDQLPKYVGVQPYVVDGKHLPRDWKQVFHESMSAEH